MASNKKSRNPNFVSSERDVLVDLVEKHFPVIENKKTDGATTREKLAEWDKIANTFNALSSVNFRTAENLKSVWENLKKAAKKITTVERMERVKTGGGPPKKRKEDPLMDRVCALIRPSAEGMVNNYDSDALPTNPGTTHPNVTVLESVEEYSNMSVSKDDFLEKSQEDVALEKVFEIDNNALVDSEIVLCDWTNYTPRMLRQPITQSLRVEKSSEVLEEEEEDENKNEKEDRGKKWTQRRRPVLKSVPEPEALANLHRAKTEAVKLATAQAKAERNEAIEMYKIKLQIEEEKLQQEKIRTELLLEELKSKRTNE